MTTGKSDPAYAEALAAVQQAHGASASLTSSLGVADRTATGAAGIAKVVASQTAQLSAGLDQLSAGSNALASGIAKLQ